MYQSDLFAAITEGVVLCAQFKLVGDSNPRYLAELNGSRVYCDDMATAEAHLDYWSKELLHCWEKR